MSKKEGQSSEDWVMQQVPLEGFSFPKDERCKKKAHDPARYEKGVQGAGTPPKGFLEEESSRCIEGSRDEWHQEVGWEVIHLE